MDRKTIRVADKVDESPDEALLVAFANGDANSGKTLLNRLGPRLFGYAARVLGDASEAEDVVQETFLRLWKIAPDWRRDEAQVSTWVYRVATNLVTDHLRRRRRRAETALDFATEPEADLYSVVEKMTIEARAKALQAAILALPERQRQAVVLRHLEGFANPEIARIMDIGVEAVESLTARGKRTLKEALAGRKEELGLENG